MMQVTNQVHKANYFKMKTLKEQTSVDFAFEKLKVKKDYQTKLIYQEAKEMQKKQMIEFAYTFSDEIITKEDIESFYEHKYEQ